MTSGIPQVLKHKGPNMIEDCGGIWGFYAVIEEAEPFDIEESNTYLKEQYGISCI